MYRQVCDMLTKGRAPKLYGIPGLIALSPIGSIIVKRPISLGCSFGEYYDIVKSPTEHLKSLSLHSRRFNLVGRSVSKPFRYAYS